MAEVNVIDWHLHPFRADRWYAAWKPALERAGSFGATSWTLIRSENDPLLFRQISIWEDREQFERYWSSDEVVAARMEAQAYYNKPLNPGWFQLIAAERATAAR